MLDDGVRTQIDHTGTHAHHASRRPSPSSDATAVRAMTSLSKTGIPGPDMERAHALSQHYGGHGARRIRLAASVTELDDVLHHYRRVRAVAWATSMHVHAEAIAPSHAGPDVL